MKTELQKSSSSPLGFTADLAKVIGALILIATGIVFSLTYTGRVSWSSPWWVIYIAIPSLVLLFSATLALFKPANLPRAGLNAGLGVLGLVLSFILTVDPTWSFTHGWIALPFFRGAFWNLVWPWAIVLVGASVLGVGVQRRNVSLGVLGALILMTGGTFLLHLSWDSTWPMMIVVLGLGLLLQVFMKKG